jgi:hypothetical protein
MKNYIPQVGDVLFVHRGLYRHFGVYVGRRFGDDRQVVHNDKCNGVVFSTLAEFSSGARVILHKNAEGNLWQRQIIADRAISLIGKKYDLINFNCEHAATFAQTGKAESRQVAGFLFVAFLFGIVLIARKK